MGHSMLRPEEQTVHGLGFLCWADAQMVTGDHRGGGGAAPPSPLAAAAEDRPAQGSAPLWPVRTAPMALPINRLQTSLSMEVWSRHTREAGLASDGRRAALTSHRRRSTRVGTCQIGLCSWRLRTGAGPDETSPSACVFGIRAGSLLPHLSPGALSNLGSGIWGANWTRDGVNAQTGKAPSRGRACPLACPKAPKHVWMGVVCKHLQHLTDTFSWTISLNT